MSLILIQIAPYSTLHFLWSSTTNLPSAPTLPTMQLRHWVTSLEAVNQITCSFFWSNKRLWTAFFSLPQHLLTHFYEELSFRQTIWLPCLHQVLRETLNLSSWFNLCVCFYLTVCFICVCVDVQMQYRELKVDPGQSPNKRRRTNPS